MLGSPAGAAATYLAHTRGLAFALLALPFRIVHAPFYYLGGGHSEAVRLRVLEEAQRTAASAVEAFCNNLSSTKLTLGIFDIHFSQDYISLLSEQ